MSANDTVMKFNLLWVFALHLLIVLVCIGLVPLSSIMIPVFVIAGLMAAPTVPVLLLSFMGIFLSPMKLKGGELAGAEFILFSLVIGFAFVAAPAVLAVLFVMSGSPLFAFFAVSGHTIFILGTAFLGLSLLALVGCINSFGPIPGFLAALALLVLVTLVMGLLGGLPALFYVFGAYKAVMLGSYGWGIALLVVMGILAVLGIINEARLALTGKELGVMDVIGSVHDAASALQSNGFGQGGPNVVLPTAPVSNELEEASPLEKVPLVGKVLDAFLF